MNRYLVIAGCSFTCYWPEILAKKLGYISANNGVTAAGNEIIHYQIIYAIDTLLNNGVDPDNILPIISWGEVNRQDFIINHMIILFFVKNPFLNRDILTIVEYIFLYFCQE